MGTRVYVGNLSYNANDNDLRSVFEQYGEVTDAKVVIDRDTDRSKGFGFVTFATSDSVAEAIEGANGQEFMGRAMKVSEAEERQPRNNSGGYRTNNSRGQARY